MKKVAIVLMVIMSIAIFVGCGDSSDSDSAKTSESVGEQCASIVPNPNKVFNDADVTTQMNDVGVYYKIENFNENDFDKYVTEAKDKGFSNIHYEGTDDSGKWYQAYDNGEEHFLVLNMPNDKSCIEIVCKIHETEESSSSNE